MNRLANVSALFNAESIWLVSDSSALLEKGEAMGLRPIELLTAETLPPNCLICTASNSAAKRTFELARDNKNIRCVFCAAQVFDPSEAAMAYSLNIMLASDFSASLKRQEAIILTVLRRPLEHCRTALRAELQDLALAVAINKGRLVIAANRVVEFVVAGKNYVSLLEEASGVRGLNITEFAVGVNASIGSEIDYHVNSQLNEGIDGLHVAIGDGACGFHIDFLCPGATVSKHA